MSRTFLPSLGLFLSLSLAAATGSAQVSTNARLSLSLPGGGVTDIAVGTASVALTAVGSAAIQPSSTSQSAPLDGLGHRERNPGVGLATDLIFGAGGIAVIGVSVWGELDRGSRGWRALRAPVILLESAALALGVTSIIKNIGGVCRPRAWDNANARCNSDEADDRRSFPSGHTAPLAALSGASLGMWLLPSGPRDPWAAGLFVASTTLAVNNLILRVAAGAHSWVDTSVGFGLGFALGLSTAALHVRHAPFTVAVSGPGVAVSGVW